MVDVKHLQEMVDKSIRHHSDLWQNSKPENLYNPVTYSLQTGGKRLRPLLVLLGYQLFDDQPEKAIPAALAVEVFHNFTLLHDDIMDKAEIRRNRPAVHIKFNENSAILSGDVMTFLAYRFLLQCKSERLDEIISLFTQTAIEVCQGQQFDMDFECRSDVNSGEYIEMIRLKSAVLLACALKTGALLGGSSDSQAKMLYDAGISLGLAFQLQDDLLDTFGDEQILGKKTGGDIFANKKTFLLIQALLLANENQKQELMYWLNTRNFSTEEKFFAVKRIFEDTKIGELTEDKIQFYFQNAINLLENLDVEISRKRPLIQLSKSLIGRKS